MGAESIKFFFLPKVNRKQLKAIESQMVKSAVATNISVTALCNLEFIKLFKMLIPLFNPPGSSTLQNYVFERVSDEERLKVETF